ncbi:MAG: hypothetical protein ACRCWB_08980 [Enterovibrio sp.]
MKKWIDFFQKKYSSQQFSSSLASLVNDQYGAQKPTATALRYVEAYHQALMQFCLTDYKYSPKLQNSSQEAQPLSASSFAIH